MTFVATTRIAVLRGSADNGLGDLVDDNTDAAIVPALADVPAGLVEKMRDVYDPATGVRRTVRVVACRVRPGLAILEGDRIKDKATGRVYALRERTPVRRSLAGQSSLLLDLEDVTSA